jgi:hypothetical protein
MKQDEIIEMARQAGIMFDEKAYPFYERLIKLVAAKEREACAKIVEPSADHRANPSDYIAHEEGIELLDIAAQKIRARGEA